MISSQKSLIRFWMGVGSPSAAFSNHIRRKAGGRLASARGEPLYAVNPFSEAQNKF